MACPSETTSDVVSSNASVPETTADEKRAEPIKPATGCLRHGGVVPSAMLLVKAAIGAGVLTMSSHCAEVGLLYSWVGLVVGGALTVASIRMIGEATIATQCSSYEDICDELLHPALAVLTGFINSTSLIGAAASYLILSGQVFQTLSGTSDACRTGFVAFCGLCICLPLSLARHVNFMRYLAILSISSLCFLVLTVVYVAAIQGPSVSVVSNELWFGAGGATVFQYMNSLNIIVFAYNNQFNVPQIVGELNPQGIRQVMRMGMLSTTMAFVFYSVVCLLGVVTFGVGEAQKSTLILSMAPQRTSVFVILSQLAVMFSVLMAFEFHVYPNRQFYGYLIRKARGRKANEEHSDSTFMGRSLTRWLDIVVAVGVVLFATIIALVLPSVRVLLDFVGAFSAAWISFVIPPLWTITLRRQEGAPWMRADIMLCAAMLVLGMFFVVFGTYSALNQ